MTYNNLIDWYKTAGYNFASEDFLQKIKSEDDIKEIKKTLMDYADNVSARSTKSFSKGQREGLRIALDADEIGGEFETSLTEREELTKSDAVEYGDMIERIKGLQQISQTDEFINEYKDIETSPEIKRTKGIKQRRKKEIVDMMAQARAEKEAERYSPTEVERGIERGAEQGETVSTILRVNLPSWMLKEKGTEYELYKEMAEESVMEEKVTKVSYQEILSRRSE